MPKVNSIVDESQVKLNDLKYILDQKKGQLNVKRCFDLVVSFLGLVILFPILVAIAIFIKVDSTGPVFFKQVRIGRDGKEFKIYKYRTMIVDAEKKGMQITVGKDHRITRIGQFLRKTKLDELPQLINVLIGDMSFVGPRPEVPKYVSLYTEQQKHILKVRPGITDIASIEYRDENHLLTKSDNPEKTYIEEIMPHKISLNYKYFNNISILQDIKIILKTILAIIK